MEKWTKEEAQAWWDRQVWPVGANYVTSDAVNDVEMWMDASFHPSLIRTELKTAAQLGFNTVRVFLSYLVWLREGETFLKNFDIFLALATEAGLSVLPILFDDCAFDFGREPEYGPQPAPVYGVHNSRWVPSPGFSVQDDPAQDESLNRYIESVVGAHRTDARILAWDLYNEPGNSGRKEKALPLLKKAFSIARSMRPVQPLTAGVWMHEGNEAVEAFCLENSDVVSLHAYTPLARTRELIARYAQYGRPLFITEWLHRPARNTLHDHLPLFRREKIGAWQWGMIQGKTQTNLSWATMSGGAPDPAPVLWQHDLLFSDGTPYDPSETALIAELSPR